MKHQDEIFLEMARVLATAGTCARRQVGCILVTEDNEILSLGYNGVPSGAPHCTEFPCDGAMYSSKQGLDVCQAIHAEQNALLRCTDIKKIHTAYTTCSPCIHCMKLLLNTSCRTIISSSVYDVDALNLWNARGRKYSIINKSCNVGINIISG